MTITQVFISYILCLIISLLIYLIVSEKVKSYKVRKTREIYTKRLIAVQDRHMRFRRNQLETRDYR
jgi:uncharacterized membrane protein